MTKLNRIAILAAGIAASAIPAAAYAQDAGESYVRVGAARTKLVDKGDVFTNGVQDPGAAYATRETFHAVITAGHYLTDMLAVEGSISTPATTNNIPAGSLAGLPNLGDDEFITASLGASFHPLKGPISPYVGGGIQMQFTTQERDGLAVGLNIPNSHGPYINGGIEYKVNQNWGLFVDVRKAWYHTNASGLLPLDATFTNFAQVDAKAELDPLTIQAGITAYFGGKKRSQDSEPTTWLTPGKNWSVKAGMASLELRDRAEMVVGGAPLTGEGISTFEHQTPTVQIGYFFNDNIAFNATLGLPPKIDVYAAGSIGALPKLGEVTYGPTAFTLQYHPVSTGRIRPYIGAGVSYMMVFDENDGAFQDLHVDNDLSLALEAGTNIMLGQDWGLFFDVKKAFLRPQVTGTFAGADVVAQSKLDPWVFSGGVGFRF